MNGKVCTHCGGMVDEDGYSFDLTEADRPTEQDAAAEELSENATRPEPMGYADGGMVAPEDEFYERGPYAVKASDNQLAVPQESGYKEVRINPSRKEYGTGSPDAGYVPSMMQRFMDREEERKRKAKK